MENQDISYAQTIIINATPAYLKQDIVQETAEVNLHKLGKDMEDIDYAATIENLKKTPYKYIISIITQFIGKIPVNHIVKRMLIKESDGKSGTLDVLAEDEKDFDVDNVIKVPQSMALFTNQYFRIFNKCELNVYKSDQQADIVNLSNLSSLWIQSNL